MGEMRKLQTALAAFSVCVVASACTQNNAVSFGLRFSVAHLEGDADIEDKSGDGMSYRFEERYVANGVGFGVDLRCHACGSFTILLSLHASQGFLSDDSRQRFGRGEVTHGHTAGQIRYGGVRPDNPEGLLFLGVHGGLYSASFTPSRSGDGSPRLISGQGFGYGLEVGRFFQSEALENWFLSAEGDQFVVDRFDRFNTSGEVEASTVMLSIGRRWGGSQ